MKYLGDPLRASASSAVNGYFNAENAEIAEAAEKTISGSGLLRKQSGTLG
jgi:hypothetical protein